MNQSGRAEGFFDLQVNGYTGVSFQSDTLTVDELRSACEALQRDGTQAILATITTAPIDAICRRLSRMVSLKRQDPLIAKMIAGIHIEGPFLSPEDGYRGAHSQECIRPADVDAMKQMLDAAEGETRLVTLAPEVDPGSKTTRFVSGQGIRVSAGHTNASLEQLRAAIDAGLSMFTHLGNGCPMQMHRSENIIQRALSLSDRLWCMFIADGVHVPFPALGNYLRAAGIDRSIVVTDVVTPAGLGPGRYQFGRWDVLVGEDLAIRAPDGSHLIGSALPMSQAYKRLLENVGLSSEQAMQLVSVNPRKAIPLAR